MTAHTLSDTDISSVVEIIDICVKRGAFEGKEISAVGAVRDKFEAFLKSVLEGAKDQAPDAPATTEGEADGEFPEAR